jgi:type II secretory pathway component PulM
MKDKKKFELSTTEISLILYALAIVIVVVAYFAVFNPKMTEAKSIEAENVSLQGTVDGIESMVAREAEVIAETAAYRQEVKDIIAKYPVDVPTEKVIRLIQDMQDINEVDISNISVSVSNLVGSVSNISVGDISTAAEGEGEGEETQAPAPAANGIGYYTQVNVSYEASYDSFKNMISYFATLSDRTTIPVISCSSDSETGMVSGSASFRMYYLTGTGKQYNVPSFGIDAMGVDNIFGVAQGSKKDGSERVNTETSTTETTTETE